MEMEHRIGHDFCRRGGAGRARARSRPRAGFSIVELLVSIAVLSLGVVAAYAAQLSATSLGASAREQDVATYAANSAIEMVTARPFAEMIDPDPVQGTIDTDDLAAFQPPYDPRGFAVYGDAPQTYPDAPTKDYVTPDPGLYGKVLDFGARIWEPVQTDTLKLDPATGVAYKLYAMGSLQRPKVLVWFEPRPTKLNGGTGANESSVQKANALGYSKLMPKLSDPGDENSAMPTSVVTAIGWFPVRSDHSDPELVDFNPLLLFLPPADDGGTFTAAEIATLRQRRDDLKERGLRMIVSRTMVKQ